MKATRTFPQIDIWWYCAGSGTPLNDMSCRKKAEFYVRIQLHSDGTTCLQSHKGTAGRNTVHVAPCDRHVYSSTAAAGNDTLTARLQQYCCSR